MKHNPCLLLLGVFLLGFVNATAQNLVQNPSFEDHKPCPLYTMFQGQYVGLGDIQHCYYWNTVVDSGGGASYCADCSGPGSTPPNMIDGYKYPRTGKCLVIFENDYQNDSEGDKDSALVKVYLQGSFLKPLQAGTTYHIGCYVSIGHHSPLYTDNFGIYISDTGFKEKRKYSTRLTIYAKPQIINPIGRILSDTTEHWTKVDGYYTAHGNEKYLTFGSFGKDQHKELIPGFRFNPPGGPPNNF